VPLATIGIVLEEGSPAPDFALISDSDDNVSLSQFRGQPVVLYFYPRDDTPGCTAQACGMGRLGGVREPGRGRHRREPGQREKARQVQGEVRLPFRLLADEDHAVAEQYGVWVEKSMLGKKYMGIERSTFLIDAEGNIAKIMRKVKPAEHADDVLAALDGQS